jgi:hypothetical protein
MLAAQCKTFETRDVQGLSFYELFDLSSERREGIDVDLDIGAVSTMAPRTCGFSVHQDGRSEDASSRMEFAFVSVGHHEAASLPAEEIGVEGRQEANLRRRRFNIVRLALIQRLERSSRVTQTQARPGREVRRLGRTVTPEIPLCESLQNCRPVTSAC